MSPDALSDRDMRQALAWWGGRPARKPETPDAREWARWRFWRIWGEAAGQYVDAVLQGRLPELSERALRAGEWLAPVVLDLEKQEADECL